MRTCKTWMAVGVFITISLAGCIGDKDELPVTSLSDITPGFNGSYTWPEPVVHQSNGERLTLDDLPWEDDLPHMVQIRLGAAGYNPHVAASGKGNLLITEPDLIYNHDDRILHSPDHGRTWEVSHTLRPPAHPVTYDFVRSGGHTVWADHETGRMFASYNHPGFLCRLIMWSDTGGTPGEWDENPAGCLTPTPSGWVRIATGPPAEGGFHPGALSAQLGDFDNVLYLCMLKNLNHPDPSENAENPTWITTPVDDMIGGSACAVSFDGGRSFLHETQIAFLDCLRLPGQPAVFPDGTVAIAMGTYDATCREPPRVIVSHDNGLTWETRTCGSSAAQRTVEPKIAVTRDGTAYMSYRDQDHRIQLARTTDQFGSCETFEVSLDTHTVGAFPAVQAGDDGRIAIAYLATEEPQEGRVSPRTTALNSAWHLYVSTSFNAQDQEPVFITQQVTPNEDPVQIGCIASDNGLNLNNCGNLGLYISMASDDEGRFYVAFVDGCTPRINCSGDPYIASGQSRDRELSLAVLDHGAGLRSEGSLDALGLSHPLPFDRPSDPTYPE